MWCYFFQGVQSQGAEVRRESSEAGKERKKKTMQGCIINSDTTQCQGQIMVNFTQLLSERPCK